MLRATLSNASLRRDHVPRPGERIREGQAARARPVKGNGEKGREKGIGKGRENDETGN